MKLEAFVGERLGGARRSMTGRCDRIVATQSSAARRNPPARSGAAIYWREARRRRRRSPARSAQFNKTIAERECIKVYIKYLPLQMPISI
jgi:hypothetical protein